eukprot:6654072-Lingulodinium_polyedra.AAC.1
MKQSELPFTHNGMQYWRLPNGSILVEQNDHFGKVASAPCTLKNSEPLSPSMASAYRGILCG